MLPLSVRRVAAAAPQSPILSSLATAVPRAAATYGLPYKPQCHQRRLSSSKPSSPDDGPADFPARPAVHASEPAKPNESKSTGEKRKRKTKEAVPASKPLPSVPSTQHLSQEALALSTFFSLHRPISVTHSFPKTITENAFAEIFNSQRAKSNKASDVISTLSHAVQELEQPFTKLTLNQGKQDMDESGHDAMSSFNLRHADGSETNVYLQLNAMSGQFLPFRPPPAPETQSATLTQDSAAAGALEEVPQTRIYKAILTIEETTDADGQYKVVAHTPRLIEEDSAPRTFLERMAWRQLRHDDARRGDETMMAISVRRQKKLRMKKKKYKQLMRRTRVERRKRDKN